MNYDFMVKFKSNEKTIIWEEIKKLKVDADQVATDTEGYEYVGW